MRGRTVQPISRTNASEPRPNGTDPGSLGAIIQNFKSISTRRVNVLRNTPGTPLWQRNYYDRIIRDAEELDHIRQYILSNPAMWEMDQEKFEG